MKKEKIFKVFNYFLLGIMLIGAIALSINYCYYKAYIKVLTTSTIIITILLPVILNKTKLKFNEQDKFIYYSFIFIAQFLGAILNLYKKILYYDLFVHFISGMVFFYIPYLFLLKTNNHKYENKLVNFLYFMGVVSFSAVVWEILEYGGDIFLGSNFQHSIDTGVEDTMWDMIVALLGGLFAYFIYLKLNMNKGKKKVENISNWNCS